MIKPGTLCYVKCPTVHPEASRIVTTGIKLIDGLDPCIHCSDRSGQAIILPNGDDRFRCPIKCLIPITPDDSNVDQKTDVPALA